MRLFNKKPAPQAEISYDDVLSYLRDLEQVDYTKLLKVVNTYRDADKKTKKILGIKDPKPTDLDDLELSFLDEDDTSAGNFLDDEPEKPQPNAQKKASKKPQKIDVKQ